MIRYLFIAEFVLILIPVTFYSLVGWFAYLIIAIDSFLTLEAFVSFCLATIAVFGLLALCEEVIIRIRENKTDSFDKRRYIFIHIGVLLIILGLIQSFIGLDIFPIFINVTFQSFLIATPALIPYIHVMLTYE